MRIGICFDLPELTSQRLDIKSTHVKPIPCQYRY